MTHRRRLVWTGLAVALAVALAAPAAVLAADLDLYQNTFEAATPLAGWTVNSDSSQNKTTWGVGATNSSVPSRAYSGANTLYCAGEAWSTPIFEAQIADARRGFQVVVTRSSGGLADVDAVLTSVGSGEQVMESDAASVTAYPVPPPAYWYPDPNPSYHGGSTMLAGSGSPSLTFFFYGDPEATNTVRTVQVLAGRKAQDRGTVTIQVFTCANSSPFSTRSELVGAQVNEKLVFQNPASRNRYSARMNGYARYPLDLRGLETAKVSFMWFIPKGAMNDAGDWGRARIIGQSSGVVHKEAVFSAASYGGGFSRWYSSDGVWTGGDVLDRSHGAGEQVILEFRFRSNDREEGEGMYIDDLKVRGTTRRPPGAPTVASATNPDENAWSENNAPTLTWAPTTDDTIHYSWTVDHSPVTTPSASSTTAATSVTLAPLADGEWYFHVSAFRAPLGRPEEQVQSEPTNYRLRIDRLPPTISSVRRDEYRTDSTYRLGATVDAVDAASGVERFEYSIGTAAGATNVRGWTNAGENPHVVATGLRLTRGRYYYMNIRAVDRAGHRSAVAGTGRIYVRRYTRIYARFNRSSTTYGGWVRAYGYTKPALRNRRIEIRSSSRLTPLRVGKTDRRGRFSILFKPLKNDRYQVRRVADSVYANAYSPRRTIRVRWRVAVRMVRLGTGAVKFSGYVRPVPKGRMAYVDRRVGRRWVRQTRIPLDYRGRLYSLNRYSSGSGVRYLRVRIPGESAYSTGVSRTFSHRFRR